MSAILIWISSDPPLPSFDFGKSSAGSKIEGGGTTWFRRPWWSLDSSTVGRHPVRSNALYIICAYFPSVLNLVHAPPLQYVSKVRRSIALKVFSCPNHRSALSSKSSHSRCSCPTNCFIVCATPASTGCHNSVAFPSPYQATPCSSDTTSLKGQTFGSHVVTKKRISINIFFVDEWLQSILHPGQPQRLSTQAFSWNKTCTAGCQAFFSYSRIIVPLPLYQVVVASPQLEHTPGCCTFVWSNYHLECLSRCCARALFLVLRAHKFVLHRTLRRWVGKYRPNLGS